MLERDIRREVNLPLLQTDTLCINQQRHQGSICQRKDGVAVRTALGCPLLTIFQTFLHRGVVTDLITEIIPLKLLEIAGNTSCLVGEAIWCKTVFFDAIKELITDVIHGLLCLSTQGLQLLDILFEEAFLCDAGIEFLAMTLIVFLEDGLAELLNMTYDVPRLILLYILLDVADEPFQDQVVLLQLFNQDIYSLFLHLVIIEFHPKVCGEIQLTSQVT